jgi:hypothetical protein
MSRPGGLLRAKEVTKNECLLCKVPLTELLHGALEIGCLDHELAVRFQPSKPANQQTKSLGAFEVLEHVMKPHFSKGVLGTIEKENVALEIRANSSRGCPFLCWQVHVEISG